MIALYRHFNADHQLLYIGISINVFTRLIDHQNSSHWFQEITTITIEKFDSKMAAIKAEAIAIFNEKPKYNNKCNINGDFMETSRRSNLLNLRQIANALGVTRQTIHNRLNSGRFPVPPIPGTKPRRWNLEAVNAWKAGVSIATIENGTTIADAR